MTDNVTDPNLNRGEHIEENVQAKRVISYGMGVSALSRIPSPLIDQAYDYIDFSNPDGNGNYQTIEFMAGGSGGALVRTLELTFDGSSNVTTITRS